MSYRDDIRTRLAELEEQLDELYERADDEERADGAISVATARRIGALERRAAKLHRAMRTRGATPQLGAWPTRRHARSAEAVAKAARPMRLAPGRGYRSC